MWITRILVASKRTSSPSGPLLEGKRPHSLKQPMIFRYGTFEAEWVHRNSAASLMFPLTSLVLLFSEIRQNLSNVKCMTEFDKCAFAEFNIEVRTSAGISEKTNARLEIPGKFVFAMMQWFNKSKRTWCHCNYLVLNFEPLVLQFWQNVFSKNPKSSDRRCRAKHIHCCTTLINHVQDLFVECRRMVFCRTQTIENLNLLPDGAVESFAASCDSN